MKTEESEEVLQINLNEAM